MPTGRKSAYIVGAAALALIATGCGGSGDDGASDGKVTLTVATFNEFGYEDLIAAYEAENPNVTVKLKKAATANEARDNILTRLAAGSGLSDIEAVEVDWLPQFMQYPDKFVDLSSADVEGRWLDWKVEQATTADGTLIGYGTDIGPEAICYRADLFEAAGMPSDPDAVAAMLGDDWDSYFDAGRDFAEKSDVPWMESAGAVYNAMINQVAYPYEDEDGTLTVLDNAEVKDIYDQVLTASEDGLSARLSQWSDDWTTSFQRDGFATMACPSWMLGVIEGNAAGVEGWQIANTFPGGGGNWGGSFLTVPTQSEHPEEAKALAAWLTAPEQQISAFQSKGTFPSQLAALESSVLLDTENSFFDGQPTGQIFSDRAAAVSVVPFKGPQYAAVNDEIQQAIARVDIDQSDDAASSWSTFESAIAALN